MKHIRWYSLNEKYYKVLSISICQYTFRILLKKVNKKWKINFSNLKLKNIDIIALYYEVGILKYKDND